MPFFQASSLGKTDLVQFLLKNGADSTLEDAFGNTPLDEAKKLGNPQIIQILGRHSKKAKKAGEANGKSEAGVNVEGNGKVEANGKGVIGKEGGGEGGNGVDGKHKGKVSVAGGEMAEGKGKVVGGKAVGGNGKADSGKGKGIAKSLFDKASGMGIVDNSAKADGNVKANGRRVVEKVSGKIEGISENGQDGKYEGGHKNSQNGKREGSPKKSQDGKVERIRRNSQSEGIGKGMGKQGAVKVGNNGGKAEGNGKVRSGKPCCQLSGGVPTKVAVVKA